MRSSIWRNTLLAALAVSCTAGAQTVKVYSPFTRIDPFGEIVPADRGSQEPREILSPALPRNATSAFHVVVSGSPGAAFKLFVGQNPDNAVQVRMYRERYLRSGTGWIPDGLEPVALPFEGRLATEGIAGQSAQSFWMDLSVARDAPVQRIKVEPQVSFDDRWSTYPMEGRVVVSSAPDRAPSTLVTPPAVGAPSDIAARRVLRRKLCGNSEKLSSEIPLTIRDFIARDALQDAAMASVVPAEELWSLTGASERTAWCRDEQPRPQGPEWYLRLRDRVVGAKH